MSVSSRTRALSRVAITVAAVCCGPAVARTAFAQTPPPPPTFSLNLLSVGDCQVVVTIENPRGGDRVGVVADQTLVREQTVVAGGGTLTFGLADPLRPGRYRCRTRQRRGRDRQGREATPRANREGRERWFSGAMRG